mgnify:CR=1 FL=1
MESRQRKHVTRQRNNFFVTLLMMLQVPPDHQKNFQKILDEKYHIIFKISRNRYSYLHPGRKKYITGRNLGTRYTEDFLLKAFEENTKSHREQKEEILEQQTPNTSTEFANCYLFSDIFCYPCTIHFS